MRILTLFFLAISLSAGLAIYLTVGRPGAIAFAVGAAISLVNVLFLHFSWKRILVKKRIALAVGVIVIKYATLGFIIYIVASRNLLRLEWFAAGLGMIVIAALGTAIWLNRSSTDQV